MKAIWSIKWYLLIGLFSYVIFLGLTVPLEFVWPKVQPHLGRLPVQVNAISGTIWQGQAKVRVNQVGTLSTNWDIDGMALMTGRLIADINVVGDELTLKGELIATANDVELKNGKAFLSSRYLEPLLRQGRAHLDGDFEVSPLNVRFSLVDKQILDASGRILFSGGDVGFPIDGRSINATLPILVGTISKPGDNVDLQITDTDNNSIGSGYIQPDGWGGLLIRRRLIDMLGQKWPAEADENAVIFEVSQKLL